LIQKRLNPCPVAGLNGHSDLTGCGIYVKVVNLKI
jgi:hypothetical protein